MTTPSLTEHAVERYRERWEPGASLLYARHLLEELLEYATPTREKTLVKHEIWVTGDIRFVIKRDRRPVCVTVLPPRSIPERVEAVSTLGESVSAEASQALTAARLAYSDACDLEIESRLLLASRRAELERCQEAVAAMAV